MEVIGVTGVASKADFAIGPVSSSGGRTVTHSYELQRTGKVCLSGRLELELGAPLAG